MKKSLLLCACGWALAAAPETGMAGEVLFAQDFEKLPVGPLPGEFLPLAGEFAVVEEGGNHFVRLPGSPLDTFGALFGPSHGAPSGVEGRFFGTKQGRKYPTFGISLRGAGGYRLQVSPGKGQLEIYKGDEPLTGVPFVWESGSWTWLRLDVVRGESGWVAEGRAWKEGASVPGEAQVRCVLGAEPPAGRAAIWGSPYSGTPVFFDDLRWSTP